MGAPYIYDISRLRVNDRLAFKYSHLVHLALKSSLSIGHVQDT